MTSVLEASGIELNGRLAPMDLEVGQGELVAVIGPNGSGKTSLLRALADVERTGGEIRVAGEELTVAGPARRPFLATYLPASRDLAWPILARDVIALGLPRPDPDRVEELVALLELGSLADRPVNRLSTGERARVLFARALAPRPRVLLLDEPLSNLDPYWVIRLLAILREAVPGGTAAIVALHDIDRIIAFDRALLMAHGEVRADLEPRALLRSRTLEEVFQIRRSAAGWELSRSADPQSSR